MAPHRYWSRGSRARGRALRLVLLEDETKCEVREVYADSEAMLAHIATVGDVLGPLVELGGGLEAEVFGSPSAELAEMHLPHSTRRCTPTTKGSSAGSVAERVTEPSSSWTDSLPPIAGSGRPS